VSTEQADVKGFNAETAGGCSLDFVAEYEPDEENEARILLMILGVSPAEIERIIEEMRLVSSCEM
jgi:hypothetical protein